MEAKGSKGDILVNSQNTLFAPSQYFLCAKYMGNLSYLTIRTLLQTKSDNTKVT